MPRSNRIAPGRWVFYVLNRGNARMEKFGKDQDYAAFEGLLGETVQRFELRLLAFCLMPNHWHLVLWPRREGDLGRFMHRLTVTHVRRRHLHRNSVGHGHVYQGLYKPFPIQQDDHFLTVCRYVEHDALRANLVDRAEEWPWSSLALRRLTPHQAAAQNKPPLSEWPLDRPRQWLQMVNEPQSAAEEQALRTAVQRGQPFGSPAWQKWAAARLVPASHPATTRPAAYTKGGINWTHPLFSFQSQSRAIGQQMWYRTPYAGNKYVVVPSTKRWIRDIESENTIFFPALITIHELRIDPDLQIRNSVIQAKLTTIEGQFQGILPGEIPFRRVPALYFGGINLDPPQPALAYVPGLVNFQVWGNQILLPKPFGPRYIVEQVQKDRFQVDTDAVLKLGVRTTHYIDNWDHYHRNSGEVHCGTNVIRVPETSTTAYTNWWE